MKLTPSILAFVLAASISPSYADATDAIAPKAGANITIQSGGQIIAILPTDPAGEMEVTCAGSCTHNTKTGMATFAGSTKIIITGPGHTPVTITGNDLSMTHLK